MLHTTICFILIQPFPTFGNSEARIPEKCLRLRVAKLKVSCMLEHSWIFRSLNIGIKLAFYHRFMHDERTATIQISRVLRQWESMKSACKLQTIPLIGIRKQRNWKYNLIYSKSNVQMWIILPRKLRSGSTNCQMKWF